ncbi:MAG: beta-propeller domain-containing protein, partial [Candidatus Bathyarchaeota archaeon]
DELKAFIRASPRASDYYSPLSSDVRNAMRELYGLPDSASTLDFPDYSETNIQVKGVDEADLIKTDGKHIYLISNRNFTIVKAYPAEEAEVLCSIEFNGTLKGAFINGERLVIFEEIRINGAATSIKVYDVSDREKPELKRDFSIDGSYFNSRMIGDYVYTVVSYRAYVSDDEVALPRFYSDNRVEEMDISEIYYSDAPDYSYAFTTVVAVNALIDEEDPTRESILLGAARSMYVSRNDIYIAFPKDGMTHIYRIHIEGSELTFAAGGVVPGYVLNQFSMDEYLDHLRIATTTSHLARSWNHATSRNHIIILNMDLNVVGVLEDLAPGERIYSARFMGDRCYLVTFRKVDPLFVVDMEYPEAPRVLGELKITGYSDYLHPYDENHIIGVGKETIAAEQGDFSWYQGVKISLFDVSEVENPQELDKYEIGNRGTDSPVLKDHKAFLFDRAKNLLVLPVLVAEVDEEQFPNGIPPTQRGTYTWQGAYVFTISIESGLILEGGVTHLGDDQNVRAASTYHVTRSLYIGNVLYTISNKRIMMNSLEDLSVVKTLELP